MILTILLILVGTPAFLSYAPPDPIEFHSGGKSVDATDTSISLDRPPEVVVRAEPDYPIEAKEAGIEGDVWIKALVDKDGKVRDVIVVKESGANAGFEDNAIEAAYKTVWKPAIANGQPVAIWVTYKVQFTLRD